MGTTFRAILKSDPYHEPAGSSKGGRFATAPISAEGWDAVQKNPILRAGTKFIAYRVGTSPELKGVNGGSAFGIEAHLLNWMEEGEIKDEKIYAHEVTLTKDTGEYEHIGFKGNSEEKGTNPQVGRDQYFFGVGYSFPMDGAGFTSKLLKEVPVKDVLAAWDKGKGSMPRIADAIDKEFAEDKTPSPSTASSRPPIAAMGKLDFKDVPKSEEEAYASCSSVAKFNFSRLHPAAEVTLLMNSESLISSAGQEYRGFLANGDTALRGKARADIKKYLDLPERIENMEDYELPPTRGAFSELREDRSDAAIDKALTNHVKELDDIVNNSILGDDVTLYRGLPKHSILHDDAEQHIGKTIELPDLLMTSVHRATAASFAAPDENGDRVMMVIDSKARQKGLFITGVSRGTVNEAEVDLPANEKYKVLGVDYKNAGDYGVFKLVHVERLAEPVDKRSPVSDAIKKAKDEAKEKKAAKVLEQRLENARQAYYQSLDKRTVYPKLKDGRMFTSMTEYLVDGKWVDSEATKSGAAAFVKSHPDGMGFAYVKGGYDYLDSDGKVYPKGKDHPDTTKIVESDPYAVKKTEATLAPQEVFRVMLHMGIPVDQIFDCMESRYPKPAVKKSFASIFKGDVPGHAFHGNQWGGSNKKPLWDDKGNFHESLGIDRKDMPQIQSSDFPEFTEFAKKKGVTITPEQVHLSSLKPTQKHFNVEQAKQLPPDALAKAVTVSSDNYVLDGTNRWARNLELNPDGKAKINRMSIPVREALDLMFTFPKVFSKTLAQVGATQKGDKDGHEFHGNQWTDRTGQTETKEFKSWFKGSKVVDKEGKPLPVYHGTQSDFSTFDGERQGESVSSSDIGYFFIDDPEAASEHAQADWWRDDPHPNVMPVYLAIKNPEVIENIGQPSRWYDEQGSETAKKAMSDGKDGLIIGNDSLKLYVAFKNTQIKSAIGNSGKFDPKDSNITKRDFSQLLKGDKSGHEFHGNQWTGQTGTPEFKKWFKGSKMVDSDGKPAKFYHGTNSDVSEFSYKVPQKTLGSKTHWMGFFFANNPEFADRFTRGGGSGANIVPVYLRIKKPYTATNDDIDRYNSNTEEQNDLESVNLAEKGFDGIIISVDGKHDEVVAFEPTQIKSAIGNSGKFDPKDSNITKMDFMAIMKGTTSKSAL